MNVDVGLMLFHWTYSVSLVFVGVLTALFAHERLSRKRPKAK